MQAALGMTAWGCASFNAEMSLTDLRRRKQGSQSDSGLVLKASCGSYGRQESLWPASSPPPQCPHLDLCCQRQRAEAVCRSLCPGQACEPASCRPAQAGREQD